MYEYISGTIEELNPSYLILRNQGIGYFIHISLTTYTYLSRHQEISSENVCKIYIYQIVREDALLLYGFYDLKERDMFKQLIGVSGIGANTSRLILSSLTPEQLAQSVGSEDVNQLKKIKGIGAKSAQRIIIDLKDKIGKPDEKQTMTETHESTVKDEALSALLTLGFSKKGADTVLDHILSDEKQLSVEELVKEALKRL
jgi:Holliday junction DNA helicase RuvA